MEMELETMSAAKSADLLKYIVETAQGPREAYTLLVVGLWRLNFEIVDNPVNINDLCNDVSASLRSIKRYEEQ